MGFFKKGNEKGAEASIVDDKMAISSILDQGISIVGDVTFKGKARIDGKIEGNIKGEYLILSESGNVVGDIDVAVMVCQGRVDGNVKAEKLHAKQEARLNGSLNVIDLIVDSGASIHGEIQGNSQDLRLIQGAGQQENAS